MDELRVFLEAQFEPGMSWANYGIGKGKWNIDHVFPLSRVDLLDPIRVRQACNYLNLQPMWHSENCSKGNRTC